jgi:hypothetical protein
LESGEIWCDADSMLDDDTVFDHDAVVAAIRMKMEKL